MKKPSPGNPRLQTKVTLGYIAILAATLALAILAGMDRAGRPDRRLTPTTGCFASIRPRPHSPHCLILAIDDATFNSLGGVARLPWHVGAGV